MKIRKVGIVGVGLMGASFALALKDSFRNVFISGYARSRRSLRKLKRLAFLDRVSTSLPEVVEDSDLVVLAAPVGVIPDNLQAISSLLKHGAVVIDLGSTKEGIVKAAREFLPSSVKFVGCHPLCGSEKSGAENACRRLYKDSLCIVTSRGKTAQEVAGLWRRLGAKVVYLSPAEHDKVLGTISHLTHVIAFAMAAFVPPGYLKFSPPSLKGIMRLSASSPYVWADIFVANRKNIVSDIKRYIRVMNMLMEAIDNRDKEAIIKLIRKVNTKYKAIDI